jgi:predicted nucleic acid-binding protein
VIELWDTSALIVAAQDRAAAGLLAEALADDAVGLTEPILLEYLNGARSLDEYDRFATLLGAARQFETTPEDWRRALEVHRELAGMGASHQRSVRIIDLIIAAVAERNGCPIVHVDEDYERIASITGQRQRRLAPRPS